MAVYVRKITPTAQSSEQAHAKGRTADKKFISKGICKIRMGRRVQ